MRLRFLLLVPTAGIALIVFAAAWWWAGLMHGLGVEPRTPSTTYNWWSGSGSVILPPFITLAGIAILAWWHHTCHEPSCLRLGRHQAAGGTFKYCQYHHPDAHPDTGFADPAHRHSLHRAWLRMNESPPGPVTTNTEGASQ